MSKNVKNNDKEDSGKVYDSIEDFDKSLNAFDREGWDGNNSVTSFNADIYSDDITKQLSVSQIESWLSNPDSNKKAIEKWVAYLYVSNSSTFQLFDTTISLPSLNHKIDVDFERDNMKSNIQILKNVLKKINHKTLTRSLLMQVASTGTVCGIWVGTKKKPVLYIFDDLNYVFPAYRKKGEWVLWLDLCWLNSMNEIQRKATLDSLGSNVTEIDYELFKENGDDYRFVELSQKKTVCINTHTLYRNQPFGLPWGTQSFLDILHKNKLKSLEKSVANKVINSFAVLSLGDGSKDSQYHDAKIKNQKSKVVMGVKQGLLASEEGKTPLIGIPHWAKLTFEDIKTDGLDPKKFESSNNELNVSTNGIEGLYSGSTNFSSGKITLDILYRKVGVLLEQVEEEVYQKLFNWILPNKLNDEYHMIYDKTTPLTTKEKVDILVKLNAGFGFSLKAVIDCIDGVDYENYLEDSFYEQEVLKIADRVKPYESSYTSTGESSDNTGAPKKDELSPSGEANIDNGIVT